ncbi:MAG: ABC transporter transmembrane domain-containing protein [Rickettsiales bacterium]
MRNSKNNSELLKRPKGSIKNLLPLLRYLRPYRMQVAGALLALLFAASAVLGMGSGLRYLVDNGLSKGDVELLDRSFFILLVITFLLAIASYARFFLVSWIGEKVVADIRNDVYRHLISMDMEYFEKARTGELLSRLTTDTTLLQVVIGSSISVAARNTILFFGGFVLLLITSIKLAAYLLVMVPVVVVPIIVFGRKVRFFGHKSQEKVANISAHAEESLNSIRTIQSFTLEEYEKERFAVLVGDTLDAASKRIRSRSLLTAIVIMLVFGAIATVLWLGGHDVLSGDMSGGQLSAFVFYSVIVAGAVGAISEVIADLQRAAGAGERLVELLNISPSINFYDNKSDNDLLPLKEANIEFSDVKFFYPTRTDKPAISDFSLDVKAGQTIALVGASGAGKSTVFQLMLRFYDPKSGKINLNGRDIRDLSLRNLRSIIGIVPQDPVIFSATAKDNIKIGNINASDEDVIKAAHMARAMEFLEKLPEGLNSHLGEKGIRLSGGQKQRIAIARAIVRNPKILLLDEATSALDSENEYYIQQALDEVIKERTTFVIAHRLSTIIKADKIILMNDGKIEATGTHDELLKKSELYARLARLQFKSAA